LLALNVPIAVAIGLATLATAALAMGSFEIAAATIAQRMATGINSFSLLAIPFFILSGLLMGRGGLARRLMELAAALVGRLPGGLAFVNIVSCMLFGAVSGSAAAAVSSIGGFVIPEMERKGYTREFGTAITITAATTGLLIPPSNIMIVYALVSGGTVSIATLFMAGILPGLTFGVMLMLTAGLLSWRRGYGGAEPQPWTAAWTTFRRAVPSLLLIVVVLGGILRGVFTATEAATIAVLYALVLTVLIYREVKVADLPEILLQTGITTGMVFLLIATSMAMSWILTLEEIPQQVSALLLRASDRPWVILLLINLLLLAVGTFMDMTPAVLIFTPILWPVVEKLGMQPVHFGIMLIANLCIGLCTPPVGTCLFVGCSVGQTTIARVTPAALPFFLALVAALLLVTYLPGLSLWIPEWLGMN
jgi:tripartite ATP-independent transporter DctM subunit